MIRKEWTPSVNTSRWGVGAGALPDIQWFNTPWTTPVIGNSQIGTWGGNNPWASSAPSASTIQSRVIPQSTGYGAASGNSSKPWENGAMPLPTAWSGSAGGNAEAALNGLIQMLSGQGLPQKAVDDLAKEYGIGKTPRITLGTSKPTTTSSSGSGYGGTSGGDPLTNWYNQFTSEHGGTDPISFYGGGIWRSEEDALDQALWDAEWGNQFARTYGRPPTDDEWKSSYGHRNAMYYGGASASGG